MYFDYSNKFSVGASTYSQLIGYQVPYTGVYIFTYQASVSGDNGIHVRLDGIDSTGNSDRGTSGRWRGVTANWPCYLGSTPRIALSVYVDSAATVSARLTVCRIA